MKKKDTNKKEVASMFILISQIGITMLTTIFFGVILGIAVDKIFKTKLLTLFIVLGVLASFKSVYTLLVKVGVLNDNKKEHIEDVEENKEIK